MTALTTIQDVSKSEIIAGKHAGKPVHCTPNALPIYRSLQMLAREGNHWARVTVEGIQSLKSGRSHQNNIFVQPNHLAKGGTEEFVLILPGCKVTVEKLPSDEFKILHFSADLNFTELQEEGNKPGLHRADLRNGEWETEYLASGKITKEKDRLVAISDRSPDKPADAADEIAEYLSDVPFSGGGLKVNSNGFDLHYTPGKKKIGRLINLREARKPTEIQTLNESAYLLARTMYEARDIPGIGWISEFGGSAVLTQAMQILADRGIKLKSHTAFLYRPMTSPNQAIKVAQQIGLNLDRKFTLTKPMDYIGNRDQLELIYNRVRSESDSYKLKNAPWDLAAYGTKLQGASTTALTIAGISTLGISNPQAVAFITAVGAVAGLGKLGSSLTDAWLPRLHKKARKKLGC